MKAPESLETLVEYGIVQEVLRPLMSGKEAQVYVVLSGGTPCVAKVYKEATHRNFKHRADYTEGRRTRNTRDQRAMAKRTAHGRKKDEDAWRSTEVDMIYRLRDAGVRVPEPLNFVEGVLVMELVLGANGEPAPRLGDQDYTPAEAQTIYDSLMRDVIKMLCAGVVHGDLSEFNVLMSGDGPVVIDFPQSVDPTQNPNSEKLFLRDVANLHRFLSRFAPEAPIRPYGEEIWKLFQANKLKPDTQLTGTYRAPRGKVDTSEVMALIDDAQRDADRRQGRRDGDDGGGDVLDGVVPPSVGGAESTDRGEAAGTAAAIAPMRRVVDFTQERKAAARPARSKARPNTRRKSGDEKARPSRGRGTSDADTPSSAEGRDRKRTPRGRRRSTGSPPEKREATADDRKAAGDDGRTGRGRSRGRRGASGTRATPPSGPASTRGDDAAKERPGRGRRRPSENRGSESSDNPKERRPRSSSGASENKPAPRKRSRRRGRGGNSTKSESPNTSSGKSGAKPAAGENSSRPPGARRRRPRRSGPPK